MIGAMNASDDSLDGFTVGDWPLVRSHDLGIPLEASWRARSLVRGSTMAANDRCTMRVKWG